MSKQTSRTARTIRSLLLMAGVGAVLAIYSVYANQRDVAIATGEVGPGQEAFFVDAAERPDIQVFFKSLTPEQRAKMSANVGHYDDPEMAKLIGKCLETFDANARGILTDSLAQVAKHQPKAVAEQLALAGSFQQLAVAKALQASGADVLKLVADQLAVEGARGSASSYLVSVGAPAVPAVLPLLKSETKDVRLAAADVLGKIRAMDAVPQLTAMVAASTGDERFGYMAALAGIGDPASEGMLTDALKDTALPLPQRAQAALGLGRIASETAINTLWSFSDNLQPQLRESSISALQIAGDPALKGRTDDLDAALPVASGIAGPIADSVIKEALASSKADFVMAGARAAQGRPELVPFLVAELEAIDPNFRGDEADRIVESLASTDSGISALGTLDRPELKGIVERRLGLLGRQS